MDIVFRRHTRRHGLRFGRAAKRASCVAIAPETTVTQRKVHRPGPLTCRNWRPNRHARSDPVRAAVRGVIGGMAGCHGS